jgi:hypothetical protein
VSPRAFALGRYARSFDFFDLRLGGFVFADLAWAVTSRSLRLRFWDEARRDRCLPARLPLGEQLLNVSFGVQYCDDSERLTVDAVDDQVRENGPEGKLLARGEVVPAMSLSRRSGKRTKSGYERPHHLAGRSESAFIKNVVSNLL